MAGLRKLVRSVVSPRMLDGLQRNAWESITAKTTNLYQLHDNRGRLTYAEGYFDLPITDLARAPFLECASVYLHEIAENMVGKKLQSKKQMLYVQHEEEQQTIQEEEDGDWDLTIIIPTQLIAIQTDSIKSKAIVNYGDVFIHDSSYKFHQVPHNNVYPRTTFYLKLSEMPLDSDFQMMNERFISFHKMRMQFFKQEEV
jgi:hypothetical protein